MGSYLSGDDLLTSNLKAARAFFEEFNKGSNIPADSPCVAATLSYASQIRNKPSPPSHAAMIAYITEAIKSGERRIDPACAAATSAYWTPISKTRTRQVQMRLLVLLIWRHWPSILP